MTCRTIVGPDGVAIGFACSRGRPAATCACGRSQHTKLCDFPLTGAKAGKTCDAKLCDRCAVSGGPDVDYCLPHGREVSRRHETAAAWLAELKRAELEVRDVDGDAWPDALPTGRGELDATSPTCDKVAYVKAQKQTRKHHCHWPSCDASVPPAMWGCRTHWYMLPAFLRARIWRTYSPGQEATMSPSAEYLAAASDVQEWIVRHEAGRNDQSSRWTAAVASVKAKARRALCGACGGENEVTEYMRRNLDCQFRARPGDPTDLYYCGCQDDPDEPHLEP